MPALSEKTTLITGGNRGIGLAIASEFANAGARVVIVGRNTAALREAEKIIGARKAIVRAVACDVCQESEVVKLMEAVRQEFGRLDVLVNNAGVFRPLAKVRELPLEDWRKDIDTNLTGTFLVTKYALALMRRGGIIVNNLSVAAHEVFAGASAYCASKFGALGFTETLREELREEGIRVVALVPGAVDTEIWNQFWPDAPRDRMISPETVAKVVLQAVTLPENTSMDEINLGPAAGTL